MNADVWAEEQVRAVEAKLGPLPAAARETLLAQHRAYYPTFLRNQMLLWGGVGLLVFWLARKT